MQQMTTLTCDINLTCYITFVSLFYCLLCIKIGSTERSLADVKHFEDEKWSNLGGSNLEKREILFTSVILRDSHVRNSGN